LLLASSTLFPYTTLFRSLPSSRRARQKSEVPVARCSQARPESAGSCGHPGVDCCACTPVAASSSAGRQSSVNFMISPLHPHCARSEEHTSELQSRENLVC